MNAGRAAAQSPMAAASVGSSVGGSSSVVRVWELSDAEAKVQYSGHGAAVNRLVFLGAASSAVASLDVAGCIHIWDRGTGVCMYGYVCVCVCVCVCCVCAVSYTLRTLPTNRKAWTCW